MATKKNFHTPIDKSRKTPFVPLCYKYDELAEKNGTKKTVFWVKKKKREETGDVKGEKWVTSQLYIGDWKMNKKDGYGIKIYSNRDKYEGYWKNDMRHGKGTYWLCIGKNAYRKLFTGDWFENKKEGKGIFFYNDGGCYDGEWKNSKRHGKGLMIYSNGDTYEGYWLDDLKDGYGVIEYENPEEKRGNKYYGYWSKDLKEGQGYYYYSTTGKIYLGEWHENIPRTGLYTTVEESKLLLPHDNLIELKSIEPEMRVLKLKDPLRILEDSISMIKFIRQIKNIKGKSLPDLYAYDYQQELLNLFKNKTLINVSNQEDLTKLQESTQISDRMQGKMNDTTITILEFKSIIYLKTGIELKDDILEIILTTLGIIKENIVYNEDFPIDFLLFSKLYYLVFIKYIQPVPDNNEDSFLSSNEKRIKNEEKEIINSEVNVTENLKRQSLREDKKNTDNLKKRSSKKYNEKVVSESSKKMKNIKIETEIFDEHDENENENEDNVKQFKITNSNEEDQENDEENEYKDEDEDEDEDDGEDEENNEEYEQEGYEDENFNEELENNDE